MEPTNCFQDYEQYSLEDHHTWQQLMKRLNKLESDSISDAYLEGFQKLKLDDAEIVRIDELSHRLEQISGWTLIPVTGLIPAKDFFYMLINKKYPVTVSIRKPCEINFSEQPDIFHDVCGHLPLLVNEQFTRFLTAYSIIALKYVHNDRGVDFLARLYWYTYEMGIIHEDGKMKAYGGAVITSGEEIINVRKQQIPKHRFDLAHVFKTAYNPYSLQAEYFYIESFDDLFKSLENLESYLIDQLLTLNEDMVIRNFSLNPKLGKNFNNVIGFLNDIQYKYPAAISFVAGQPDEQFFDIPYYLQKFDTYVDHMAGSSGKSKDHIIKKIGQYNKTKGIVNDILSQYLKTDENITIAAEHILVTVGAQEAFATIVSTICHRQEDVVLVEDPSYIGLSSFGKIFDYDIRGIKTDEDGIDLKDLRNRILQVNAGEKKVKLLYVIPDYQNPSGSCMPLGNRLKLLELARQYNFLIIEDTVYNSFTYAQKKNPTLKSLDRYSRVIYVGSFSKSLFPGLRIGLIAADQQVETGDGEMVYLADEMAKVKAQLSNNTPTINQAMLGGVLIDNNYSLHKLCEPKLESYRQKRNKMIDVLNKYIKAWRGSWAAGISWNEPDGGFFIKMNVPFEVDDDCVREAANKFKVVFCPMRYFYLSAGGRNEIRLTFSNLSLNDIDAGVKQFADYLQYKTGKSKAATEVGANETIVHA
jgi:monomeric phenylalanine-4-hydroxylase